MEGPWAREARTHQQLNVGHALVLHTHRGDVPYTLGAHDLLFFGANSKLNSEESVKSGNSFGILKSLSVTLKATPKVALLGTAK